MPNKKLQDAAKLIEQGKINKELLQYHKELVATLKYQIDVKDSIIRAYVIKDTAGAHIVDTYRAEVKNLKDQLQLATTELKKQNKYYRRQKRKTVFVAIAGPAVTAATIFYLKK